MAGTIAQGLVLLLGALMAVGPLTTDMYLPALPALADSFGAPPAFAQYTLSSYFVGLAIGQLVYGPLSDAIGRKPPLYIGLVIFVIASAGCALSGNIDTMIFMRFVQALGGGCGMVISTAVVRDFVTGREAARTFSTLLLVRGVAPILAPLLGGYLLALISWRAIFVLLAAFGVICIAATFLRLPETLPPQKRRRIGVGVALRNYALLLRTRRFVGFALAGGFPYAGMFVYITASPHIFISLFGLAPTTFAWFFGSNAAGLIGTAQLNHLLLRRWSYHQVLAAALAVHLAAACVFLILALNGAGPWTLWPALFLTIASLGCVAPNATAAALSGEPHLAGTASSITGTIPYAGGAIGGVILGFLADRGAVNLAGVMATCALIALMSHRWLVGKRGVS